ncbi:MAG TPA: hypothetical protein VGD98_08970 [Ktedonobacteraceae bacterium]
MANYEQNYQVYDNLLKRLLERNASSIIPRLLASNGLEMVDIVEELNVEVLIPPRRNDRVFSSLIRGTPHITHFEIEISGNTKMAARLLIYHALLFEKYHKPVRSVIVYPFKTTMVESPMREKSNDEELVTFHFQRIPLWELDAHEYFDEQDVCMYALLPAMRGATQEMHMQAIAQMIKYYQDNDDELRNQLLCFGVMMRRAEMLPTVQIKEVLEKMKEYDPLIAEDKYLQALIKEFGEKLGEKRAVEIATKMAAEVVAEAKAEAAARIRIQAEAEARAKAEAVAEAEASFVATYRETLISILKERFPALVETVVQDAVLPNKLGALQLLIGQVLAAADERAVRAIFCLPVAK